MLHHSDSHRTVQDDRAELDSDVGQTSPLAEGEGAPLAEDNVPATGERTPTAAAGYVGFIGGTPMTLADVEPGPSADLMATPDDKPLGD